MVCSPLITTLELLATKLSAEITVTSPMRLASLELASGWPAPVSEVTVLASSTIRGAERAMMLAPAWGWMPLEVTSVRRR